MADDKIINLFEQSWEEEKLPRIKNLNTSRSKADNDFLWELQLENNHLYMCNLGLGFLSALLIILHLVICCSKLIKGSRRRNDRKANFYHLRNFGRVV